MKRELFVSTIIVLTLLAIMLVGTFIWKARQAGAQGPEHGIFDYAIPAQERRAAMERAKGPQWCKHDKSGTFSCIELNSTPEPKPEKEQNCTEQWEEEIRRSLNREFDLPNCWPFATPEPEKTDCKGYQLQENIDFCNGIKEQKGNKTISGWAIEDIMLEAVKVGKCIDAVFCGNGSFRFKVKICK